MGRNVLVVDLEYYPLSTANTVIAERICSLIGEEYRVTVATLNHGGAEAEEEKDRTRIIRTPNRSLKAEYNMAPVSVMDRCRIVWLKTISKIDQKEIDRKVAYYFLKDIQKATDIRQYDAIVSFSSPFISHYCASKLAKQYQIPWIAYYLDPFFSNATLPEKTLGVRRKFEEKTLDPAARAMLTYPTDEDYLRRKVAFSNMILRAEMPGIVQRDDREEAKPENGRIRCVFFGSLYRDIRNPDRIIRAFAKLKDIVDLYFVGTHEGIPAEEYERETGNIFFTGKVSGEELKKKYAEADILMNIGNTVTNQMPSKIFEYISTGKPIINITKMDHCPTTAYLDRYPLAISIPEDALTSDPERSLERIRAFCEENRGKQVPYDLISREFRENSDLYVANALQREIELQTILKT